MDNRIETGYCCISGEPIFEIIAKHTSGPLEGHVSQVGPMLPEAVRLNIIQTNGRHIPIRVHKDFIDDLDFKELWKVLINGEMEAHDQRQYFPNYNEVKALEAHRNQLELLSHPPIGVL